MSPSSAETTSAQVDIASDTPRHKSQGRSNSATAPNINGPTVEGNDSDTIFKNVRIDQYGDLKLIVGEEKVCFLVCSRTLSRTAPFWKTLLYGSFSEAKPIDGHDWRVQLPEDHPGAIEVILNLIHWPGHPEKINAVDLDLAFEVVVLTNKYSMTQCLAPYARNWLDVLIPVPEDDFKNDKHLWAPPLQWLFLAQELGDLTEYLTAYEQLAIRCDYRVEESSMTKKLMHYNPTGEYQPILGMSNNVSAAGKVVIANLVGEISSVRLSAIQKIKSMLRDDLEKLRKAAERHMEIDFRYVSSSVNRITICKARRAEWTRKCECDFSMFGYTTLQQGRIQWPLTHEPEDERDSVYFFRYVANSAIEEFNDDQGILRGQEHEHCTPFTAGVLSIGELERYVTDIAKAKSGYIRRQAVLSGVERGEGTRGSHKRTRQQMEQSTD